MSDILSLDVCPWPGQSLLLYYGVDVPPRASWKTFIAFLAALPRVQLALDTTPMMLPATYLHKTAHRTALTRRRRFLLRDRGANMIPLQTGNAVSPQLAP